MRQYSTSSIRRAFAGALLGAALIGGVALPASATAAAPTGVTRAAADMIGPTQAAADTCQVTYTITDSWAEGFNASVTVHNNGPQINNWRLTWDFPGTQQVYGVWNGLFQQDGTTVTVTGDGHNFNLLANGSVTFGLTAGGAAATPTLFTLNGMVCAG